MLPVEGAAPVADPPAVPELTELPVAELPAAGVDPELLAPVWPLPLTGAACEGEAVTEVTAWLTAAVTGAAAWVTVDAACDTVAEAWPTADPAVDEVAEEADPAVDEAGADAGLAAPDTTLLTEWVTPLTTPEAVLVTEPSRLSAGPGVDDAGAEAAARSVVACALDPDRSQNRAIRPKQQPASTRPRARHPPGPTMASGSARIWYGVFHPGVTP